MTTHAHDGTAWREATGLYAHDGTAWRTISNAYAHDGTTWREVFASFALTATTPGGTGSDLTNDPTAALVTLTADVDGFINATGGTPTAFGTPTGGTNATGKYWKWTYVSGATPTAGTTTENTWTAVGSGQVYMLRNPPAGTREGVVAISFANDGSGSGATTPGNWTLTATVEP